MEIAIPQSEAIHRHQASDMMSHPDYWVLVNWKQKVAGTATIIKTSHLPDLCPLKKAQFEGRVLSKGQKITSSGVNKRTRKVHFIQQRNIYV